MKKDLCNLAIGCCIAFSANAQSQFEIVDTDRNTVPVCSSLYGSFYELGFGRSDLLWGELLFNRDFELIRPLGEKNPWLEYSQRPKEQEDWWHSGYEEQKWYLWKENKKEKLPLIHNNYWPSAHGKYFVQIDSRKEQSPILLAQDRIYIKKGTGYNFSGLFSVGTYFNAEKETDKPVSLKLCLFAENDWSHPVFQTDLSVHTNQFAMHNMKIAPVDYEGWCTFAIEVPGGNKVALDLLSLSADDNIKGWKKEPLDKIKRDLRPKSIRFPGGCFASLYDWRDGVGPRENRPVSYDSWWECELVNDVGTCEFMDMCGYVGAEPFFCVPVMFSDAFNAAEWVDFCNNPDNERRIAYGYKEPLNVKYWELENEPYRKFDALTFANRCVDFAKKMKAKDPSIKIAIGNYWVFFKKFREMLEIAGPYVDLITNRGGSMQEQAESLDILNEYNLKHGTSIQLCHTEFRAPLSRSENSVDGLNQVENKNVDTRFNCSAHWEYGMNVADQYIQFQNLGGNFYTANYTNLTDGWGEGLINIAKEKTYLSAAGIAFSLLSSLDLSYPQVVKQIDKDKNIVLQAAWNSKRDKLTLVVLNFNQKDSRCLVDLRNLKKKFMLSGKGHSIAPSSPLSFNNVAHPNDVKIETFEHKTSRKLNLLLKPMSLYTFELDLVL